MVSGDGGQGSSSKGLEAALSTVLEGVGKSIGSRGVYFLYLETGSSRNFTDAFGVESGCLPMFAAFVDCVNGTLCFRIDDEDRIGSINSSDADPDILVVDGEDRFDSINSSDADPEVPVVDDEDRVVSTNSSSSSNHCDGVGLSS